MNKRLYKENGCGGKKAQIVTLYLTNLLTFPWKFWIVAVTLVINRKSK